MTASKRLIAILMLLLGIALLLSACGREREEEGSAPEENSSAPATERELNTAPRQTVTVESPGWGFPAHSVVSLDGTVVTAELDGEDVVLTSYNPGETEVHVLDCFGHKAVVKVTVADDEECTVTHEAKPCEEEFVNAADYGVVPGKSPNGLPDQSVKLQLAIDKVWREGGGTVFLYPGFYNIKVITMRDGVTLKMYSGFADAREGYTDELAEKVKNGEVTVLTVSRILNTKLKEFGRNGSSSFTVSGGVLDNNHVNQAKIYLGLCKGVTIENMVFKDINNGHFIQITGCEDITVRNCIFAGYKWNGNFNAETIQIEQSHPGAHSSDYANAPVRFEQGEIFGCKNITIDSCYFGPSDELPGHHIAIGHHGSAHEAVADGLRITNNVFECPSYAAIRFATVVDVEITGNRFTATAESNKLCTEADPAFIILYSSTGTVTYENSVDGRKITRALSYEKSGTHNVSISDNEFAVGAGSDKRIVTVKGSGIAPGGNFENSVLRQDAYDSAPYYLTGYFKSTNYTGNVSIRNNKVTYEGQPTVRDCAFKLYRVYGYSFEDNEITLKGFKFANNSNGVNGLSIQACYTGEDAETYFFKCKPSTRYISIRQAGGEEVRLLSIKEITHKLIAGEGGRLELASDNKGNITVEAIPLEGYSFVGWHAADALFDKTGDVKLSEQLVLRAIFEKN